MAETNAIERILAYTKGFAKKHAVDLALPNCEGSGVGNVLVYTRLIEEFARHVGRRISIITAPLAPKVGVVKKEIPYPFFEQNPFIEKIINAKEIDQKAFELVNQDEDTLVQTNHIIENICFAYGLRPRALRASLFLSNEEKEWAFSQLVGIKRPLICLHPGGTTSSAPDCPWYRKKWLQLIKLFENRAGFIQIGRPEFVDQDLGLLNPGKTIREAIALIWASDIFIGYDSSPMHMATALQKPVITIIHMQNKFNWETSLSEVFTPSVMLRWTYPQNHNFAIMPDDDGSVLLEKIAYVLDLEIRKLKYNI